MQVYIPGEDVFFESFPIENGKKVIIYLSEWNGVFFKKAKCFAKYYLEQIFNENDEIISETIKENPHYVEDPYG